MTRTTAAARGADAAPAAAPAPAADQPSADSAPPAAADRPPPDSAPPPVVETAAIAHAPRGVRVRALIDLPEYQARAGAECEVPAESLAELKRLSYVDDIVPTVQA